ncbi:hypothetical protein NIES2119_25610 [[Phormidium ambiguum] IAM M-71]|uniref:SCP domain-containing protein n=1 Tax=[Phormidium ambiguum] IAM M-71 TaxID=454136 RepID=A0A1U7I8B1_9CYAN|nr:CAP domain-containing protein [Phormidium ambiguum]OKH32662.1 hypothetical protein NIES2119_25610 [Phormidium ambiguum IAM M-71]
MGKFKVKAGLLATVVLLNVSLVQQAQASVSQEVIQLVNQARSQGRLCGNQRFASTQSVSINASLNRAAQAHSSDMAARQQMSHTGSNGSSAGQRAKQAGYGSTFVAENVGLGYTSASAVVNGWLKSPGHCRNIMNPAYNEAGVGAVRGRDGRLYWTMKLGRNR